MHRYAFKTVKPADLAMLREWLAEPHIRLWWGDPETRLERMIEAMDRPDVTQLIGLCDKIPFAYLEHHDVRARGRVHQTSLPPGTRAIEALVGVSAMMWKGHGTAVLHRLCIALDRRGIPTLSADLDVSNKHGAACLWPDRLCRAASRGYTGRPSGSDAEEARGCGRGHRVLLTLRRLPDHAQPLQRR